MAEEGPLARVIQALDEAIDSLPKEGLRAAVAVGLVSSVREMVERIGDVMRLSECIAVAKEACRGDGERFCNPSCAKIYLVKTGEEVLVYKSISNVFSARASPGEVIAKAKNVYVKVSQGKVEAGIMGVEGYEPIEAVLTDANDLYKKSYSIKYAVNRIMRSLRVAAEDLRACAARQAIVC